MRILNLFGGIGGNRKEWGNNHTIVTVEFNKEIARLYKELYPDDTVLVGCAYTFLLKNYDKFDFIWASPPCQSHSAARRCRVGSRKPIDAVYPDFRLYEVISLLQTHKKSGHWVVENVKPYYEPLIKESVIIDRHYYWSNFHIEPIKVKKDRIIENVKVGSSGIDFEGFKIKNKVQVIRNMVNPEIGKHILNQVLK